MNFNLELRNKQSGLSLIELMIAMVLSLIIGAAVIQVFISQRETYRAQDDLSRVQENARFAFEQISRDLRHVGYWGCSRKAVLTNTTGATKYNNLVDDAVREQSNEITIFYLDPSNFLVNSPSVDISALSSPRMISDCTKSTIFAGNSVPGGYPNAAQIYGLLETSYNVIDGGLFRGADNIVDSGVDSLSLRYGLAGPTGWASSYVTAADLGSNWSSVVSVEVNLTLSGEIVAPQTFSSVIAIRNRLP